MLAAYDYIIPEECKGRQTLVQNLRVYRLGSRRGTATAFSNIGIHDICDRLSRRIIVVAAESVFLEASRLHIRIYDTMLTIYVFRFST